MTSERVAAIEADYIKAHAQVRELYHYVTLPPTANRDNQLTHIKQAVYEIMYMMSMTIVQRDRETAIAQPDHLQAVEAETK